MITRRFIEKVHYYFDELNFHITTPQTYGEFEYAALNALAHSAELCDAQNVINMAQFCYKHWGRIEKIFEKKLDVFNEYAYEGSDVVSLVSDEEAQGTYFITNGLTKKLKEIYVASESLEDLAFMIGYNNGKFKIFEDGDYYLKYATMSSSKMKLFNKHGNCLCNMVLSNNASIFLENNKTNYELVIYDDFIGIYERNYIDSLSDEDIIDTENLVADIEWDLINKNSELGVAKLNIYQENNNFEMLLAFATSTFLIFQRYMSNQRAVRVAMIGAAAGIVRR